MNHIVIIGFMGSGKTKVGKHLASDLNLQFVDVDKAITEKMKMNIGELNEKFGEPYYRALETFFIKELLQDSQQKVISLSSGGPMQEQNAKYLKELGTIVYLKASAGTLIKRLEKSGGNTILESEDGEEKFKKLLKQREPVYEKFSDVQVVTGVKPFMELIEEIKQKIEATKKNS